eukprot:5077940-Pyramimonas_sp.AAC.1
MRDIMITERRSRDSSDSDAKWRTWKPSIDVAVHFENLRHHQERIEEARVEAGKRPWPEARKCERATTPNTTQPERRGEPGGQPRRHHSTTRP